MGEVTMKIGEGLGDLMLSMAQENILKGDTDKAIDLYVNGLNGFTKEWFFKACLQNTAYNYEEKSLERFNISNEELSKASLKATFISSLVNPTTRFINSLICSFLSCCVPL